MSTKAQDYRVEQQRAAHPPRPKGLKKLRKEASRAGTTLEVDVKPDGHHTDRAARHGGSRLEVSESGRPSRKSTRKSEGHIKLASNLTRRAIRKTHAPKARAAKAATRAKRS